MNIIYIANIRFPSERAQSVQIVNMCQAFSNCGHDVTLYVNTRKTPIIKRPEEYYGFDFLFKLERIYTPDLTALGKWFFALATFIFSINALRKLRHTNFDVIYSRSEWILFIILIFRPRVSVIFESHEAKYSRPVQTLIKRNVPIVVISEGIRDFYLARGVPEAQLLVAHDGIDESFFQNVESKSNVRQHLGLKNDKPIAMYIGGLDAWKGITTFLEAATHNTDVQFVVIGGRAEEVERYSKKYPRVQFLGQRPYNELKNNQQAADVLVIPNTARNKLSAEYTSPLKLFAHMTAKKPLVLSDIPSLRVVVPEDLAYYSEPDNPTALAQAVERALCDKTNTTKKVLQLYENSKEFTWNNRAKKILDFTSL